MPPVKKSLDKVQKPPAKRVRKTKPPLKTPTIISIQIPVRKETLSDAPVGTQILNRKQLTPQIKLDLANEVARAQLVKGEPIIFDEPKQQVAVAKRGRPKKVVSNFFLDNEVAKEPEIQLPKKVLNRKVTPVKAEIKAKAVPKKRQADSTVRKPIKRPRLLPQADTAIQNKTEANKFSPRVTRRSLKGKQADAAKAEQSPSILTGFDIVPKIETDSKSPTKLFDPDKGASLIGSRKPSLNSIVSSGPSWIRDISSTSTTTCVTVSSNEFVRFNYKLPVIKLTNIDNKVGEYKNNSGDESSSSSLESDSSDSEDKYPEQLDRCIGHSSPKLSVSSSSNSHASNTEADMNDRLAFLLDKLKSVLKTFDMEIINGLRFDNEEIPADLKRLKDKLFDVVNNEFGIINQCKHVRRILDPESVGNEDVAGEALRVEVNQEVDIVAPDTHTKGSNDFEDDMPFDININNIIDTVKDCADGEPTQQNIDDLTSNKCNYVKVDPYDDDDALSLFAESITGIDPSRLNSSVASMTDVHSEEYIPQPVKSTFASPDKYIYCPTKIGGANNVKPKTICEKQNADSTSVHRDTLDRHEHENIVINDKPDNTDSVTNTEGDLYKNHPTCLILPQFKPRHIRHSTLFQGVCYYNLINSCKNSSHGKTGRFPHFVLDAAVVKKRLATVNEECFIQEYVAIRSRPELRRLYGMCFVNECVRRELTRILVEMSLDFVKKTNTQSRDDSTLMVQVAETILLHLNKVGFTECEDLLRHYVMNGTQLCDFFMSTIAATQNFTRFKNVFTDLVSYMVKNDRNVCLPVASSILERVGILPYDEGLARTLLEIIKLTSRKIFDNSMIGHYEKQISSNKVLFEDYLCVKRSRLSVVTPVIASPAPSSPRPQLPLQAAPGMPRPDDEGAALAPSPDTTDYDNMNKNTVEPEVKRTLNFNRDHAHNPNVPPTFVSPNSSQLQRVIRKDLPAINNWKRNAGVHPYARQHFSPHRSYFGTHRPHFGPRGPHSGLQRQHFSPQWPPRLLGTTKRVVTYADNPTVCRYTPRRPGPNY